MPDRIIRGLNGPQGASLFVAAFLSVRYGIAYGLAAYDTHQQRPLPTGLEWLNAGGVLPVWAALWIVAGIVGFLGSYSYTAHPRLHLFGADRYIDADHIARVFITALMGAWSIAYFYGAVTEVAAGQVTRSDLSAFTLIALAVLLNLGRMLPDRRPVRARRYSRRARWGMTWAACVAAVTGGRGKAGGSVGATG